MREKYLRNEHGQALIFISLAFVVLGMFIGLAVDGGRAYLMHERLRKIVDASSLAGAKAMADVPEGGNLLAAVQNAACESAMINGLSGEDCNTAKLTTEVGEVTNPDGTPQQGVIVTGTDAGRTFFMSLGALIGCETCRSINVAATGKAVPDTLADVVLVLDDTGTMSCSGSFSATECAIEGAKAGAKNLIDKLFNDSSHAMIAYVPFRGCYTLVADRYLPQVIENAYRAQGFSESEIARRGCIQSNNEMVSLTKASDKDTLKSQIETRVGSPGFPGTNICLAMIEGQKKLFAPEAREIARKIMIILTDGSQNYSDFSDGGVLPGMCK